MTAPTLDLVPAADALSDLVAGSRIVAGNACGTPLALLRALGDRAPSAPRVSLTVGLTLGDPGLRAAVENGALGIRSWHVHGEIRGMLRDGLVEYLPLRLVDVPSVVLAHTDVAFVRLGPPDAEGYCSLGPSASFTRDAIRHAGLVIAEISDDVPRTAGDSRVHVSEIDRFVDSTVDMPRYESTTPTASAITVARLVGGLIPDRATVQLGIGAIGDALAAELSQSGASRSIRLHGMVSDPMIPLVRAIAERGEPPVQAVELLGSAGLMSWVDGNAVIEMRDSQSIHHPAVIAGIRSFVSVNSAVAVDVRGQVVAETVRGGVISGVGGSADFSEGAHLSPGGMRIIALASTTAKGQSTIVASHGTGDLVTAAHHSVDAVVTDHGVAWLRGRTAAERRDNLISVAAPEHRDALAADAAALRI
ncbi:acetyl-CoA hydrolase/transferase family protein [Microbacterium koreense]|uniref:Acetyl-CoA hydrolase/transferase family protein n=1 Tax=Microbacterium koreense TaxID=323761 RepID=A0ABW2ZPR1_9MICO